MTIVQKCDHDKYSLSCSVSVSYTEEELATRRQLCGEHDLIKYLYDLTEDTSRVTSFEEASVEWVHRLCCQREDFERSDSLQPHQIALDAQLRL